MQDTKDIINVLIVEDEEIWIKGLEMNLVEFGFGIAGICRSVQEALEAFNTTTYDIVLMDINLQGTDSGIELGKIVQQMHRKPFIYITAAKGNTSTREIAATYPSAYLIKPIHPSSLFVAIQNAIHNFDNHITPVFNEVADTPGSFFVKQGSRYKKINWNDVVYLSSGKNYLGVFNAPDKTEYFIRSSLQKTLDYIVPATLRASFIQVNRSEAIQGSYVEEIDGEKIKTAYKAFSITDTYLKDVKKKLNIIT